MERQTGMGWRMQLGIVLLLASVVLPLGGIPLLTSLGLDSVLTTTLSGGLLIGAEVLGVVAIAVMGKDGFAWFKQHVFHLLKQFEPPQRVSQPRYLVGLILFSVPLLFGWLSVYLYQLLPGLVDHALWMAVAGDLMLLTSLVVLGGDFWDKVRSLFVHDARATFTR